MDGWGRPATQTNPPQTHHILALEHRRVWSPPRIQRGEMDDYVAFGQNQGPFDVRRAREIAIDAADGA